MFVDECRPWFFGEIGDNIIEDGGKFNVVFVEVGEEIICSKDLGNPYQLVIVILSFKQWFFFKDLQFTIHTFTYQRT